MAEMLLLNPRKRARRAAKKSRKSSRRRNPVPAGLARYMASKRKRRTISAVARRVRRRRSNPSLRAVSRVVRRRRNPISLGGSGRSMLAMIKSAMIGGAGAVAVDVAMGQLNRFLPATLQRTPGKVSIGDAVKAAITVVLGRLLAKSTRGLSQQMAAGALTVQAHQLLAGFVPASMTLGYGVPARVVNMSNRVGPIRNGNPAVGAYQRPGSTPLLSAYLRPGSTPMLNRARMTAQQREGVTPYS